LQIFVALALPVSETQVKNESARTEFLVEVQILFNLAFFREKIALPGKSGKLKIFRFYRQGRHGTRFRLENGRGYQIFGPFCDFKATLSSLEQIRSFSRAK
jgi:hypothetical protein